MQQHAARGLHTSMEVYLGVGERHRDELEHLLHARVDAAQVREAHGRRRMLLRAADAAALGAALVAARRA